MIPVAKEKVPFTGDTSSYERVPAGAYVCKVVSAVPNEEKQYLLLNLDIIEGEFAHYGEKVEEKTGKDFGYIKIYKSWKDNGKGDGENPLWFFQQMLARFEKENEGKYQQNDSDEKHLIGLKVGVVLRDEEYIAKNGEIKVSTKFYNFAEISRIHEGQIKTPKMKVLPDDLKNPPLVDTNTQPVPDDGSVPF